MCPPTFKCVTRCQLLVALTCLSLLLPCWWPDHFAAMAKEAPGADISGEGAPVKGWAEGALLFGVLSRHAVGKVAEDRWQLMARLQTDELAE